MICIDDNIDEENINDYCTFFVKNNSYDKSKHATNFDAQRFRWQFDVIKWKLELTLTYNYDCHQFSIHDNYDKHSIWGLDKPEILIFGTKIHIQLEKLFFSGTEPFIFVIRLEFFFSVKVDIRNFFFREKSNYDVVE